MSERVPMPGPRKNGATSLAEEAGQELEVRLVELGMHVRAWRETPSEAARSRVCEDLQRIRNTLVLIDQGATAFVVEETLALLDAEAQGEIAEQRALHPLLGEAVELLTVQIHSMTRRSGGLSALWLLPLVNDIRACRGAPLLSASLIAAMGVELPEGEVSAGIDPVRLAPAWQRLHQRLQPDLLAWFRGDAKSPSSQLKGTLDSLTALAHTGTDEGILGLMFAAAGAVMEGLVSGQIQDGPALRRLYAQIERLVAYAGQGRKLARLLPPDLVRNLLYYAARVENGSTRFDRLYERHELQRIRQLPRSGAAPAPVESDIDGESGLRVNVEHEVARLLQVLSAGLSRDVPALETIAEIDVALGDMAPIVEILGEDYLLTSIEQLRHRLDPIVGNGVVDDAGRQALNRSMARLEAVLARGDTGVSRRRRHRLHAVAQEAVSPGHAAMSGKRPGVDAVFLQLAEDACVCEMRQELQSLARDGLDEATRDKATDTFARLAGVARMLGDGVLADALDEARAGLCEHTVGELADSLPELLAAIDAWLLFGDAASDDLDAARTVFRQTRSALREVAARKPAAADQTTAQVRDGTSSVVPDKVTARSTGARRNARNDASLALSVLDVMDAISSLRQASHAVPGEVGEREAGSALEQVLGVLASQSEGDAGDSLLHALAAPARARVRCRLDGASPMAAGEITAADAAGANDNVDDGVSAPLFDRHEHRLLEDVQAMLPQLLEDRFGQSDEVRGLDQLLAALVESGPIGMKQAGTEQGGAEQVKAVQVGTGDSSAETLPELGDELAMTLDNVDAMVDVMEASLTLEETGSIEEADRPLHELFHDECRAEIDLLRREVDAALADRKRSDEGASVLPNEDYLRVLHSLVGSARTVGAEPLLAPVNELQRLALTHHRNATRFATGELWSLRQELDRLQQLVDDWVLDVAARASDTAADTHARVDDVQADGSMPAGMDTFAEGGDLAVDAEALAGTDILAEDGDPAVDTEALAGTNIPLEGGDSVADTEVLADTAADTLIDTFADATGGTLGDTLQHIFAGEARELLDAMTAAMARDDVDGALAQLHTLKGSARMARMHRLAEEAHVLESEVEQVRRRHSLEGLDAAEDEVPLEREWKARSRQIAVLESGRVRLQNALLDQESMPEAMQVSVPATGAVSESVDVVDPAAMSRATAGVAASASTEASATPGASSAPDSSAMALVSDESDDSRMLALVSELASSQSRVSHSLGELRERGVDIEQAALVWQRKLRDGQIDSTEAQAEAAADLQLAREGFAEALRQAERIQQQAARNASFLQQRLIRAQLVRADAWRERLAQVMDDTAKALGVEADLAIVGGGITLERSLFQDLRSPLEHLVRNAVVHGIERPSERQRNGKPDTGQLTLRVDVDGTDLLLIFADDGRGVRDDGVEMGSDDDALSAEVQKRLLAPGYSTSNETSMHGGRGMGLYALQREIDRLQGSVRLFSKPGEGLEVQLRVPQRLAVIHALVVRSSERLYALSVNSVVEVIDAESFAVGEAAAAVDGEMSLDELLGLGAGERREKRSSSCLTRPAVRISSDDAQRVLRVDEVLGFRELLHQDMGVQLAALGSYAGVSVLPDGRPVLTLDLHRLLVRSMDKAVRKAPPPRSRAASALVVDDSITVRVALGRLLAEAGVEVSEARDGIEALEYLDRELPNVMLIDLDMPRLDGFGLLKQARQRFGDACPPMLVISSRDDAASRSQVMALGAEGLVVKPCRREQVHDVLASVGVRLPDLTIA